MLKINTYTDESGQDTKGKVFVVCTIIILSDEVEAVEKMLAEVESDSDKNKKWHQSGDKRRHKYINLLLEKKVFNHVYIYYSEYKNKIDYTYLVGSHIAKVILSFVDSKEYNSKIFIDKMDKRTMLGLTNEIKKYRIKYKKIRGLTEESNTCIRLVDALCGLIRDIPNKQIPNCYKVVFSKMKQV